MTPRPPHWDDADSNNPARFDDEDDFADEVAFERCKLTRDECAQIDAENGL